MFNKPCLTVFKKYILTKQKPVCKLPLIFYDLPSIMKHHCILDEKKYFVVVAKLCFYFSLLFLNSRYIILQHLTPWNDWFLFPLLVLIASEVILQPQILDNGKSVRITSWNIWKLSILWQKYSENPTRPTVPPLFSYLWDALDTDFFSFLVPCYFFPPVLKWKLQELW